MDAAKAAIKNFTHHGGHHDTTVHEHVNPAVQQERLTKQQIEETTTVVDKEVHQDHYHTTVQPVRAQEVLPEKHSHHLVDAESREYHHGNREGIKERLAQEAAQFKSTRTTGETVREEVVAPTVGAEHVHHHIHETVQPVIQKDVIQPVVVHTTVPVHETHHEEPKHHGATALPAMSIDEFKSRGGTLEGCADKVERFDGIIPAEEVVQHTSHGFHHHNSGNNTQSNIGRDIEGSRGTGITGSGTGNTGIGSSHHNSGITGTGSDRIGSDNTTTGSGNNNYDGLAGSHHLGRSNADSANVGSEKVSKPSLLDKLNPMKDSNGDGVAGFMK